MKLEGSVSHTDENEIDVISDDDAEDLPNNPNEEVIETIRICRVCLIKEADTVIIPCRHAQTCNSCTETIASTYELNKCPVCRGPIESFLKIFL